jgi:hypothetical protein
VDVLLILVHTIDVTSFDIDYTLLNLSISSAHPLRQMRMDIPLLELYERGFRILLP